MEKSPQVEEEPSTTQLQHKLQILEEEWNSMKQQFPDPNPKTDRLLWRRSSSSCTPCSVIINGQRVPEGSPRGLMSSLQQQPPETRETDLALISGKLIKAGRLFEDEEEGPLALPDHLDAATEVGSDGGGGSGGGRRSMTVARVCVLVAVIASVISGVRRFCRFGFGEEIVLVPT